MVHSELDVLNIEEVPEHDYACWEKHKQAMLDVTLYRKARYCRGRLDDFDDSLFEPADIHSLQERQRQIDSMCNGNWLTQKFTHVECGCCEATLDLSLREVQCEKFLAALIHGVDVLLTGSGLPAESKWGTMQTANAELVLASSVPRRR